MGLTISGGVKVPQGRFSVEIIVPPVLNNLFSWGRNQYGQLGDETTTQRTSPVLIGDLTDWSSVDSGYHHSLAVKNDGTLWTWGRNNKGQLGHGNTTNLSSPSQVGSLTDWASVSSGLFHSLAVKTDGTIWSWGENFGFGDGGGLGLGDTILRSSPVQIGALTTWATISAQNYTSHAIKTDGTLWGWGRNKKTGLATLFGQVGDGTSINRNSPVQIGALTNWASLGSGSNHTIAVKTDGTLWGWGHSKDGRLGDGSTANTSKNSPIQIGALTDWSITAAAYSFSHAIKTDGTLWSWGKNGGGYLGNGNTNTTYSPAQIGADTNWSNLTSKSAHTLAIRTDATLWSWGSGNNGKLGHGNTIAQSSPTQVGALTSWADVSAGAFGSVAIKTTS